MKGQLVLPRYKDRRNIIGNPFGSPSKKKKRKPFKISTKKMEWNRAAGRDAYGPFIKTSYCRNLKCRRKLVWGDRSYEFDHKDNNPSNNSQKNCWLVCKICHARATVIKKRKIRDRWTGMTVGHETYKKKVSYKKVRAKKHRKKHRKNREYNPFSVSFKPPKIDLGF